MVAFADPFIVTLPFEATDDEPILLFEVVGDKALILAAGIFEWVDLDSVRVETSTAAYERIDGEDGEGS